MNIKTRLGTEGAKLSVKSGRALENSRNFLLMVKVSRPDDLRCVAGMGSDCRLFSSGVQVTEATITRFLQLSGQTRQTQY